MKRSSFCFIALFALLSEIVFNGVVYSEETESTPANSQLQIPASGLLVLKNGVVTQLHTKGYHSLKKQIPFTENSPFRIASNTKPYVAAAIFRLVEEERLSLNDPISVLLPENIIEVLKTADYVPQLIQLQHLLSHTSGLRDHATSQRYLNDVFTKPNYRWRPMEQIKLMSELGPPLHEPGKTFAYSDTGYILLGQIIEQTTRQSLAEAVQTLLDYKKLRLHQTWWEFYQSSPDNSAPRIHQYIEGKDFHDWHPSMDLYGGGGLVSTLKDMALFTEQLLKGKVFRKPETLDLMMSETNLPSPEKSRYGVLVTHLGGESGFGHSGFWGTVSWYFPQLDITVAGLVSDQKGYQSMQEEISQLITELKASD